MFVVLILAAFAAILCIFHVIFKYNKNTRLIRKIPSPKDIFFVGNTLDLIVPPVELFNVARKYAKKFNGIFSWWAFFIAAVNIYNPEDIEIVTSGMKHSAKSNIYSLVSCWLREGLLLSKGSKWQSRRKILNPTFHFNILRQFFIILEENNQRLVDELANTQGESVDIVPMLSEYTLNSICETAMGTKLHDETSNAGKLYKKSLYELGKLTIDRFSKVYYYSREIYNWTPSFRETRKHLDVVHGFTERVINDRKEYIKHHGIIEDTPEDNDNILSAKKKKIAMLDLLIKAEKEGIIDSIGIQEEVDTFMFKGHDTTAAGLSFFFMSIANHKSIQDKIYTELKEIYGDSNRVATYDDLSKMRYLERCIKESLRLYPPVPFISRELSETAQLSNYTVPGGTACQILIFDLHRRADLFENPLVFDPDRFLPENSMGRHPYAYIPFSAGPRNCIGQKFAMMEMKSCIAAVLRTFELFPITTPSDLVFGADLVLRSVNPICVKFVERNKC